MRTFLADSRYALRTFSKSPLFTIVAVLTTAIGIGLNTAVFSVVYAVLLRSLPFPDADRLVTIWEHGKRTDRNVVSPANFLDWKAQNHVFDEMAALVDQRFVLRGVGDPEELQTQTVSPALFRMLRLNPVLGRTFNEGEGGQGAPRVVILSYGLWQRRFGGDRGVVGRGISLDDELYTVVGVMPPAFQSMNGMFNDHAEAWMPLRLDPGRNYRKGSGRYMVALGRLKDGITLDQARAEMSAIALRLEHTYPEFNKDWRVNLVNWHTDQTNEFRPALILLAAGVGMVLLIACANVANLLVVRGAGRRREIAIRAALGGGRTRLLRQLITESVLLSTIGGALGLVLARYGILFLLKLSPNNLPRMEQIGLNMPVLWFTVIVAIVTGVVFGLAPAFDATRVSLNEALRAGSHTVIAGRQRFRNTLVAGELALSVVLLVGAALLVQSFLHLRAVQSGFDPSGVVTMKVMRSGNAGRDNNQITAYFRDAVHQLRTAPGFTAASAITFLPLDGLGSATGFTIVGKPEPEPGKGPSCDVRMIFDGYFHTMRIPILRGRDFNEREATRGSEPLRFVVSRSLADQYFPGEDPIGKKIVVAMAREPKPGEIIGVVGDIHHSGLDVAPRATVYYPQAQLQVGMMTLVARSAGDTDSAARTMLSIVKGLDPAQPVTQPRTMEQYLAASVARWRFEMVLLSIFAGVALLLASIGLYGVLSTLVAQRVPELGIRMALGATSRNIFGLIVGRCIGLAAVGIACGVIVALALSRLVSSFLYAVKPTDTGTYVVVAVTLLVVALLASYLPARRATRVDPLTALRYE